MRVIAFAMLVCFVFASCTKKEDEQNLTITEVVKTGDWMLLYFENGNSIDIGNSTFLKFNSTGSVVATMDAIPYTGTWTEVNTNETTTLNLNITTTDTKLQKANKTWKLTRLTEGFINFKDANPSGNATLQLMKH